MSNDVLEAVLAAYINKFDHETLPANDPGIVQLRGAIAEYAKTPTTAPSRAGSAAWYANRGLRVFPLLGNSKRPLPRSHGVKDATLDNTMITFWFAYGAGHNIGIAAGGPFDVIDIDGDEGARSFIDWIPYADLDVRGISQTPRGFHIWIPASGDGNSAKIEPGIDYRGEGGYVVAPPSVAGGKPYRWLMPPIIER